MEVGEIRKKIKNGETLYGVKIDGEVVPKISIISKNSYTYIDIIGIIEKVCVYNHAYTRGQRGQWDFDEIFDTIQEALDYVSIQTTKIAKRIAYRYKENK